MNSEIRKVISLSCSFEKWVPKNQQTKKCIKFKVMMIPLPWLYVFRTWGFDWFLHLFTCQFAWSNRPLPSFLGLHRGLLLSLKVRKKQTSDRFIQSSGKQSLNRQYMIYNLVKLWTDLEVIQISNFHLGLQWDELTEKLFKTLKSS